MKRAGNVLECVCISCDKKLERYHQGDMIDFPPMDAVHLQTHGNYGSKIFDSFPGPDMLELYVCDECLVKKAAKIYVLPSYKASRELETLEDYLKHA